MTGTRNGVAFDADVAIVGFGPVGQALAILLGRAGHDVVCLERHHEIYRMPRAVHIDHEIMRILQALGVAEELGDELLPLEDYRWFGADGEPLMTLVSPRPAASGWESDYMFFQPALENALDRAARSQATVDVRRGVEVEGLETGPDRVTLTVRPEDGEAQELHARYVIGADGANSFVRESLSIPSEDLGFRERWLVIDVEPNDMHAIDLPIACQWCDPARPTTHIQSGPRHRRWEFMLLPGEDADELASEARVWELLSPWFRPGDGELTRHTVYEFRSLVAERMREGRVLLAGDAAHLTPPFLGQGLCSGLRDAANIAWKLDLVLRGDADEGLLDTVTSERQAQNKVIIELAINLGRFLCQLDPVEAAARDEMLRAADSPPPIEPPPLGPGALRTEDLLAGTLAVQGQVATASGESLLDDVTGNGFTLITTEPEPDPAALADLGITLAALGPSGSGDMRDADGRMSAWLEDAGACAALVRPDFYVFGSAAAPAELPALVADLRSHLRSKE